MSHDGVESDDRPNLFGSGPLADPEERRLIFAALDSFRQYRRSCHFNTTHRRRQNLYALTKHHWNILAEPPFNILDVLNAVDDAVDCNADIADAIWALGIRTFDLPENPPKDSKLYWHGTARSEDMLKAHSTIRQFYRDWTSEGFELEVEPLLRMILKDLSENLIDIKPGLHRHSLLLPGAGLGRMLLELSLSGFDVEGNEISYHQLMASNFILNATTRSQEFKLYPFVTTFTNHISRSDQLKHLFVPDIHPSSTVAAKMHQQSQQSTIGEMNMSAGDFLTTYLTCDNKDRFDAVITVYFIDTAPNLIRYIETVKHCLKDGGIWINVGPLLWHFDDRTTGRGGHEADAEVDKARTNPDEFAAEIEDTGIGEPGSFELSDEEVLLLVKQMGFEILTHEIKETENGGYIQDPTSMIQNRYRCSHWVARKKIGATPCLN